MAEIWPVNLRPDDKRLVTELERRFMLLGEPSGYVPTLRMAVKCMLELPEEDIKVLLERAKPRT